MTAPIHARKNHLQADSRDLSILVYPAHVDSYKTLFSALYAELKSWRRVAKPYSIHPNMARMIANGYDPGNRIRERLQLPEKQPVEICEECGKVLTIYHKCKSRPRPPRIAIRLDDPESAARSIQKYMEPELIAELVEIIRR